MLLTKESEELEGIGPLLGDGLLAWKTVLLEPDWPYYLVRLSTNQGDAWKVNTFLVASEVDLGGLCVSVANDNARRIEDITQLVTSTSGAQQSCELSKIGEIWEGEERLEGETGSTTVLLLDLNGRSIGSDPRSVDEVRIRAKLFPRPD
jgi:hypothetical protein